MRSTFDNISRIGLACALSALACGSDPPAGDTDGSSTGAGDTESSPQTSATTSPSTSTTTPTDTTTEATTDDTTGPGGSVSTGMQDDSSSGDPTETTSTSSAETTTGVLAPCVDENIGMLVGDDIVSGTTVDTNDDFKLAECFGPGPSTTGIGETGIVDTEGPPPPETTSAGDVVTSDGGSTSIGEFWGDDYVIQWTPPESFVYTISITGSDFDNIVGVYPPVCASEYYSCNDDCYGVDAGLQFDASEGETVFIVVDGRNGQVGSFSLSINQGAGVCGGGGETDTATSGIGTGPLDTGAFIVPPDTE